MNIRLKFECPLVLSIDVSVASFEAAMKVARTYERKLRTTGTIFNTLPYSPCIPCSVELKEVTLFGPKQKEALQND